MKAYYNYYNTSLLVFHEYNLQQKSLYELYTLRKIIKENKNYIVKNVTGKIIDIIEKVINSKSNGEVLMRLVKDNSILAQAIINNNTIKREKNFKLLKIYKNINKMEKIFNLKKNTLLSECEIKERMTLEYNYLFFKMKEKLLLCKI